MAEVISIWRDSLHTILDLYERKRGRLLLFLPCLFLFFILLNITCYWWAIYTAFPFYMETHEASHYVKLQVPVGFFGALFDSLSFFVTIWIIKRALAAQKTSEYFDKQKINSLGGSFNYKMSDKIQKIGSGINYTYADGTSNKYYQFSLQLFSEVVPIEDMLINFSYNYKIKSVVSSADYNNSLFKINFSYRF